MRPGRPKARPKFSMRRTTGKPLFSKAGKKAGTNPRLSIPEMHPNTKGKAASRYRRVGKPVVLYKTKVVEERVKTGQHYDYSTYGYVPTYSVIRKTVPAKNEGIKGIRYRVSRQSKKSKGRKGGGGGERVSQKSGSSASRRNRAARVGGTKGGIPKRQKKK